MTILNVILNLIINVLCLVQTAPFIKEISNYPAKEFNDIIETNVIDASSLNDSTIFDLSIFGNSLYRLPDFNETGRLLTEYGRNKFDVNPEELGSYVEGDILVPATTIVLKNGIMSRSSRWPNARVPYEITGHFRHDEILVIKNAILNYHKHTCIRFVPHSQEMDYISIGNTQTGCWSSIGRIGGKQNVNLQTPGCLSKPGTVIHELMHVLGFLHEQNRQERDAFVAIRYENIKQAAFGNFKKVTPTISFGIDYDYASVMHYSAKAFSQNGQATIEAMEPSGNLVMGQRDGFSPLDIEKINRMYNCYK